MKNIIPVAFAVISLLALAAAFINHLNADGQVLFLSTMGLVNAIMAVNSKLIFSRQENA